MKAILIKQPGPPENMYIGAWEKPQPKYNEILVKVAATALNRADTLQRQGKYPPPQGASPILGLEIAGEVVETGTSVRQWKKGDLVFGLVPGGAYAEYAVIHEEMALKMLPNLSFTEAVAIPEVFLTAYQALAWLGCLQSGEKVLVHAGASGVGTAAIQIARALGAEVLATASASKHDICSDLGAKHVIDYHSEDFHKKVMEYTSGQGVDVIIDFIAANYFQQNLDSLNTDGRLVILALLGGVEVDHFNLAKVLVKRLQIMGSTLRARNLNYQIRLCREMWSFAKPLFAKGNLKAIIDSVLPWTEVVEAHHLMESNKNKGKIILKIE